MQTLSFGYLKPETGDKGSVWFPALEDNIQQLNDHTHDGITSSKISAGAIEALTQTLTFGNWNLVVAGTYRQLVTMPGALQFDTAPKRFVLDTAPYVGHEIFPSIEKVTANTFYVYINNNTLNLKVIYT